MFDSYATRIRVLGSWIRATQERDQHFDEKHIGFVWVLPLVKIKKIIVQLSSLVIIFKRRTYWFYNDVVFFITFTTFLPEILFQSKQQKNS